MAAEWNVWGFREMPPLLDPRKPTDHWSKINAQAPLSVYKNWYNDFQVFLRDIGAILYDLQTILWSTEYRPPPTDKTSVVFKAGEYVYHASSHIESNYRSVALTKEHALKHLAFSQKVLANLYPALDAMLAATTTNASKKTTIQTYSATIKKYSEAIQSSIDKLSKFDAVNNTDLISSLATKT